jgi:uncharacterized membrane protein YjjP (DUF1212 family)
MTAVKSLLQLGAETRTVVQRMNRLRSYVDGSNIGHTRTT